MSLRWDDGPDRPSRALGWLGIAAGAVLFGMMMLTVVDVIGRYFFNAPVPGSAEATELLLAAIVFAGLPVTAARGEHIRVDLLEHLLGAGARRVLLMTGSLVAAAITAIVAWRLWLRAAELLGYDERSSHLNFPLSWLAFFMAATSAVAALGFLWHAAAAWRERHDRRS